MESTLEGKLSLGESLKVWIPTVIGAGVFIFGSSYCICNHLVPWITQRDKFVKEQEHIKSQLSENSIYVSRNMLGETWLAKAKNEDVNNDGLYESVLYIKNPNKDITEKRLIQIVNGEILISRYYVKDGEIKIDRNY